MTRDTPITSASRWKHPPSGTDRPKRTLAQSKPALFLCDRDELREEAYDKLSAAFGSNARLGPGLWSGAAMSEIIIYEDPDAPNPVQVTLEGDTVWLTQAQMAELFQVKPQNITMHLKKVYADDELHEAATCKEFLQVQTEGARRVERTRKFYNLDAIISDCCEDRFVQQSQVFTFFELPRQCVQDQEDRQ